ncbi:MAG: hypothetical protein DMG69_27685 [Acidobacteria bacterium]|nr:MAG: hypothetical protein DMG69_27685 [Acidobacteriota bacterium]
MQIPLRRGRLFSETDTNESAHVAIVNESLARRYLNRRAPEGQYIELRPFGAGRCQSNRGGWRCTPIVVKRSACSRNLSFELTRICSMAGISRAYQI